MKDLAIYIDELDGEIRLSFREDRLPPNYYYRPLSYLPRLAGIFQRLWHTEDYKFRPFFGGRFGIVIEKVE